MKRLTLTHFALAQLILLLTAALFLAACSGAAPAPNGGAAPAPTAAGGLLGAPVSRSAAAKPPAARNDMFTSAPPMTIDPTKTYRATLETNKGNIVMDLYPQDAPQTVNNFVFLAREGFYDGLTFHRYEPGFVIQGGDPLGNGTGGPGYTIPPEIKRTHPVGAVAMARRGGPPETTPSSGSQFYITLDATPNLDGGYTSFGQVTPESMAVVMQIRKNDVINKITIEEK